MVTAVQPNQQCRVYVPTTPFVGVDRSRFSDTMKSFAVSKNLMKVLAASPAIVIFAAPNWDFRLRPYFSVLREMVIDLKSVLMAMS